MELLGQTDQFKSLHWFQSVNNKFKEEREKISVQKSVASRDDEKLQQTLSLTEKRINAFERVRFDYFAQLLHLKCFISGVFAFVL